MNKWMNDDVCDFVFLPVRADTLETDRPTKQRSYSTNCYKTWDEISVRYKKRIGGNDDRVSVEQKKKLPFFLSSSELISINRINKKTVSSGAEAEDKSTEEISKQKKLT